MILQNDKKVVKFEDSFLTFSHYKEPLREVPKGSGFGYMGAVLVSLDGKSVQCHVCGKLFSNVGLHIKSHGLSAKSYKAKYELSPASVLVSEEVRQSYKQRAMKWYASLSEEEKKEWISKRKSWNERKTSKGYKHRLEEKNKRGTCPDQLLAKITEIKNKIGRVPTVSEFEEMSGGQRYKYLIYQTFGSWVNALKMLNLEPAERKSTKGRRPKTYTDEELIEYLRLYAQETGKVPTATDARRGLLPANQTYLDRFGTWENARIQAKIYEIVDKII